MTGQRMTRRWRAGALAAALAGGLAGCGSAKAPAPGASAAAAVPPLTAMSSVPIAGATWATVPMGAAAGPDEFWQLFRLPAGGRWTLETPPDIATNGAILLAGQPGTGSGGTAGTAGTLAAGVRPSLDLTYSPITTTADGGRDWATLPPASGLASEADALAAAPGGQLLALGQDHTADVYTSGSWASLTSERALAAAPAARGCALTGLTAAAYTPAGLPLLAGACGRAGRTGIFRDRGGSWQQAGPALPPTLAGQTVQVARLTRIGHQDVALLEAGGPPDVRLLAAWTSDGQHWTLSPVLRLGGAAPVSASFGADGGLAVVLAGGRAVTLAGPGAPWRRLPALPDGRTVTLALPGGGGTDALAADGGTLTVWRLAATGDSWVRTQTVQVPIQYGSSG